MQVNETLTEGLSREFEIVIPAGDLDERLMQHLESIKNTVNLKGFRPGKVPVSHLKRAYGKSIMGDIIQEAVTEVSNLALKERDLRPAQQPDINFDEDKLPEVVEGKADLAFKMAVEVMPEFETGDLSKVKLVKPVAEVSDGDVDEALAKLAEQQKTYKPRAKTAKAKEGDQLTLDFVGRIDGEEFEGGKAEDAPLVLGSNTFIPGFEDQLTGAKTGEERTVKVTFPEDYTSAELAGKDAEFDVTVKEVAEPQAAEVNDEMAKALGLGDLAALKEMMKGRIEHDFGQASREKMKRNLLDVLDEMYDFDLPPKMLEQEFDQIWTQVKSDLEKQNKTFEDEGQTEDEAKTEYGAIAERRVRLGLLMAEIGRLNNIEVTEDEITRAVAQQASQYPGQEKQFYDLYMQNPQLLAQIRAPLFEEKIVDFIVELAEVKEEKVTRDELYADPDDDVAKPAKKKAATKKKTAKKKTAAKKTTAKKKTAAKKSS